MKDNHAGEISLLKAALSNNLAALASNQEQLATNQDQLDANQKQMSSTAKQWAAKQECEVGSSVLKHKHIVFCCEEVVLRKIEIDCSPVFSKNGLMNKSISFIHELCTIKKFQVHETTLKTW